MWMSLSAMSRGAGRRRRVHIFCSPLGEASRVIGWWNKCDRVCPRHDPHCSLMSIQLSYQMDLEQHAKGGRQRRERLIATDQASLFQRRHFQKSSYRCARSSDMIQPAAQHSHLHSQLRTVSDRHSQLQRSSGDGSSYGLSSGWVDEKIITQSVRIIEKVCLWSLCKPRSSSCCEKELRTLTLFLSFDACVFENKAVENYMKHYWDGWLHLQILPECTHTTQIRRVKILHDSARKDVVPQSHGNASLLIPSWRGKLRSNMI